MSLDYIPVLLNTGDQHPIGFGKIVDDELVITVRHEELVARIERLAQVGDIKELFLGFGFVVAPNFLERATELKEQGHSEGYVAEQFGVSISEVRAAIVEARTKKREAVVRRSGQMKVEGYSNAEIADALGLPENDVRIILAD